jgi:hypothetical protein
VLWLINIAIASTAYCVPSTEFVIRDSSLWPTRLYCGLRCAAGTAYSIWHDISMSWCRPCTFSALHMRIALHRHGHPSCQELAAPANLLCELLQLHLCDYYESWRLSSHEHLCQRDCNLLKILRQHPWTNEPHSVYHQRGR